MIKSMRGFTIVELLVVISIIGILATITFMGFGRYQQDSRDNARAGQAKILAESLEKYYQQNGEYPGCPALTGAAATVTTSVLPGTNQQTLVTPQAPAGTTNSIQCTDLTSISQPDIFAYVGDGSAACTTGQACLSFQLKYKQESTGQIITLSGRHQTGSSTTVTTPATVPGTPSISATQASTSQINLSWIVTSNTTSYTLQQATNSTWTANLVTQNITGTASSYSATGLSTSTTYYFRLQALNGSTTGTWSNTASAATAAVYVPPPPSAGGAPVYAGSSSVSGGSSGAGGSNLVNYTTSCPSGSSPVNGTFNAYHADTGVTYNDTFGTVDVLYNFGPTNPIYAQYSGATYQCQNSYGTSGYSPTSGTTSVPVYM